jgi:MFS family permease
MWFVDRLPLSDRYGRRPLLFFGFAIYLFATFLCIRAENINELLFGRFFQGLGIGAGAVLSRVMLRDQFAGNQLAKMASYLNVGVSVATTIAPALGGVIQEHFNYQGNFIALFFIGLMTLCLLVFVPETNSNKTINDFNFKNMLSSYRFVLSHKIFVCNVICAGLALSALIAYSVANPFLVQTVLGLSPASYGVFALFIAGSEVIGCC